MASGKITVTRLAFVHYQHPDLEKGLEFLKDFGLVEELKGKDRSYLRGYGNQPYIYVAEQSPDDQRHFLGGYWEVQSREELERASRLPGASSIQSLDGPGGGEKVTVRDPNDNIVGFVHGQNLRQEETQTGALERNDSGHVSNTASDKVRKGTFRRFDQGASPVHKLGHYGYMTPPDKFQETFAWYTSTLNLKVTDCVYDGKTGKDETCFMHIDLGPEYTDHHSFFVGTGEAPKAHVHHSSFEVNDFDTQLLGHHFLRSKGWTNCWGIGRHVLGSQVFDYWFDGSGNVIEHYSDGDLVNEDTPMGREAAAPNTLYVWGPNIPLGFATGRIEDAGKPLPLPPDVLAGTPAQLGVEG